MNFNRKALSRIDSFWRSFFNADSERSEPERDRSFGAKKRPEPKPSVLRLESLEDRALLSVAPTFAVLPGEPNPAAVLSEYSAEPAPAVPDLASAFSAVASLQTQTERDAGDLAVVTACRLNPDDTTYAKWNASGRLTYLNCDGSSVANLDLSGCVALATVNVRNCANLTSLDLSGLQSLSSVSINDDASLTDLDLNGIKSSSVYVYNNGSLAELNVAGMNAYSFSCYNNAALTSVTASNCQSGNSGVTGFSLYDNPVLTQIDLTGSTVGLSVYNCASATSLNLATFSSLKSLSVHNMPITGLDLSDLQSLSTVHVYDNANLTSLDLSGLQAISSAYVYRNASLTDLNLDYIQTTSSVLVYNNNALAELEITGMNASSFSCYNNASLASFTATDSRTNYGFTVNNNPVLTQVDLSDNPQQKSFNVYGNAVKTLNVVGCSDLQFLSCGEDALDDLYIPEESSFELRFRDSSAWNSVVVRGESGTEIPTNSGFSYVYFIPGSYASNPITASFYAAGSAEPVNTATVWKGAPEQGPTLEFNQYSKTVTAITDKNVVLTRGVVATGIDNPTYTVYIDGVKSTKITVNKTWGQIVYSGGNNGMPARSEPYVVTVTASAGGKSASADFLLTVANDSKISTTVSTNSPKYNTAVRATVKPTGAAVTYQWYRTKNATPATAVWTAIEGATKSSYVPTSADLGYYLKVMVRGTGANDGHATQAITSGKVTRPIVSVTLPTTVEYNKTITAFMSPSSATATYQWYRGSNEEGWTAIKNATGMKYVPQLADVGKFLKVTVTGKDNFTGAFSKVTGKRVTASLVSVTASGNLKVGSKITSYLAPSSATATYQWYSSKNGSTWTAITGATSKTYTPTDADAGKYLKVTVKGTGYFKGTVTRTLSGKIAAASTSASAQDAFAGYEDAVLDGELDEFWNTLEETLNN